MRIRAACAGEERVTPLMMRHGLGALCGLALMTALNFGLMSTGSVVLSLSPSKMHVKLGDEITVQLLFETVGQEPVWIPGRLIVGGDVWVEVRDASNRRLTYLGEKYTLKPLRKDDFLKLNPNHVYGRHINLAEFYKLDEPGKYLARASFKNEDAGQTWGLNAWTGSMVSNELEIIIEP